MTTTQAQPLATPMPARAGTVVYRARGASSRLRFTLPLHAVELNALDPHGTGVITLFGIDHYREV